jgi:hypothetical protein
MVPGNHVARMPADCFLGHTNVNMPHLCISLLDELGAFTERPVVSDAAARGLKAFPPLLRYLWLLILRVLTQCSCEGLLW